MRPVTVVLTAPMYSSPCWLSLHSEQSKHYAWHVRPVTVVLTAPMYSSPCWVSLHYEQSQHCAWHVRPATVILTAPMYSSPCWVYILRKVNIHPRLTRASSHCRTDSSHVLKSLLSLSTFWKMSTLRLTHASSHSRTDSSHVLKSLLSLHSAQSQHSSTLETCFQSQSYWQLPCTQVLVESLYILNKVNIRPRVGRASSHSHTDCSHVLKSLLRLSTFWTKSTFVHAWHVRPVTVVLTAPM